MRGPNLIERLEDIMKIAWIIVLSVFAPIAVSIYVLTLFFIVNIFGGYHADRIVNQKSFNLEKIGKGISLLILYFVLLFIINISLSLYNEITLAESIPKFFTWMASYFYLINIIRNAKLVYPNSEGLKFFYEVLTIQIFDIILKKIGLDAKKINFYRKGKDDKDKE